MSDDSKIFLISIFLVIGPVIFLFIVKDLADSINNRPGLITDTCSSTDREKIK